MASSQSRSDSSRTRIEDGNHHVRDGEEESDRDSLAERPSAIVVRRVAAEVRHSAERGAEQAGVEKMKDQLSK